jgi:hypothetical protein
MTSEGRLIMKTTRINARSIQILPLAAQQSDGRLGVETHYILHPTQETNAVLSLAPVREMVPTWSIRQQNSRSGSGIYELLRSMWWAVKLAFSTHAFDSASPMTLTSAATSSLSAILRSLTASNGSTA